MDAASAQARTWGWATPNAFQPPTRTAITTPSASGRASSRSWGNGQHAAPVNGNGHPEAPDTPQPSLLAWAEFMAEEPVKPKRRRRKTQAPALSLFEWALDQKRAVEPAGAGRWRTSNRGGHQVRVSSPAHPCMGPFLRCTPDRFDMRRMGASGVSRQT